jgi:chromate reductase
MITVFSGTNRKGSRTRQVAEYAYKLLQDHSTDVVKFFSLEDLPLDLIHHDMYEGTEQSEALAEIQNEFLIPASKFYFVIPEYNGSYPGILKFFLDACSIREYKSSFHGDKKAALLGLASGRAGNLRGMDHLTGVLNYLKINVMPIHQPISSIEKLMNEDGEFTDDNTQHIIQNHIKEFIRF